MMDPELRSATPIGRRDGRRTGPTQAWTGVAFAELRSADLIVDANYAAGRAGNAGDDPLSRLLPVGNRGGFRYSGNLRRGTKLVVLLVERVGNE